MNAAVLLGMLGPLVVVIASWALMVRTYRRDPSRLTSMMLAAFALKMIFFGAYVALALTVFSVRPTPFIASFLASFVASYVAEAIGLRRLLASR